MCAAVIQMQLTMLTKNPFRKYFPVQFIAIRYAQMTNIISQKNGSKFDGIQNTVAIAIASPNSDN
jgi:hypothetical protein